MKNEQEKKSVLRAVVELREAAEAHGRAQQAMSQEAGSEARLKLLSTRITADESLARAVEACSSCGRLHCDEHG